ncbi:hypothetical protein [Streptomyces phaeochromogenes]|uniref:hypothetical protein n=1 Tax=Streptomyces phaeochromogenes TaxID=1923 RepID=UPI00371223C8
MRTIEHVVSRHHPAFVVPALHLGLGRDDKVYLVLGGPTDGQALRLASDGSAQRFGSGATSKKGPAGLRVAEGLGLLYTAWPTTAGAGLVCVSKLDPAHVRYRTCPGPRRRDNRWASTTAPGRRVVSRPSPPPWTPRTTHA